jgi:hypothetical protein
VVNRQVRTARATTATHPTLQILWRLEPLQLDLQQCLTALECSNAVGVVNPQSREEAISGDGALR